MNADVETLRELCAKYKVNCENRLRSKGFTGSNLLRSKGLCGTVTKILGKCLSEEYAVVERAVMKERITNDNKEVLVWGRVHPGFFNGHVFVVVSDIIVDGAFHQYMDAFNIAHEEPNDILVVSYSRLDEKVDDMVKKCQSLPQGVRDIEHLRKGLRSVWDYKQSPSRLESVKI